MRHRQRLASIVAAGLALATLFVGCQASSEASPVPSGYKLVWGDEFNEPGLPDPKKWDFETQGNLDLWGHNERQYYTDKRFENARVEDGHLKIEARKEALTRYPGYAGQEYSSAKLLTRGIKAWKYGFFDIRAKLPCGRGNWPAIWLLSDSGRWPFDGEIDLMEMVGYEVPTRIHSTLHDSTEGKMPAPTGSLLVPDACQTFHNYQMDWRKDSITFMVDGRTVFHAVKGDRKYEQWPYDHKFFLILNVAVGGAWGAVKGIDPNVFPAAMEIDYVRVYQGKID